MEMEDNTCRLCGIKIDIEYSKYIFDEVTNLVQIINETLPIKVSQDDHSKHICLDCYNKVISHHDFIQNVLAHSKESETKIMSYFEVNRNEKLENVVISKLQNDIIHTCPNCNKDLILLVKSNSEDSNCPLDISLAAVNQIQKLVEENSQIFEDPTELVSVCTQKSENRENELHELSLNHDIVDGNMTNDNEHDINGIHKSSQCDTNHTNLNIILRKPDVLREPNKGTKRKFQESVPTETSINSTCKLQKLKARLDAMEQDADELNSDYDRLNVTGLTFQSINNGMECLYEEIVNEEENSTEYTMKRKHFNKNLTKTRTLETRLNEQELSSDHDGSSLGGLIAFQPEKNDMECLSNDIEIKDDSITDITNRKRECINEDNANSIDITKSYLKHVCNLCGARYISQLKYKFHMKRHKYNKIDRYVCLICDQETKNENSLWDHYRHMHRNPMRYTCLGCNKTFREEPNLDEHQRKFKHSGYRKMVKVETDEDNNQTQKVAKQKRKCTVCRKFIKDIDPDAIDGPAMCAFCEESGACLIDDGEAAKVIAQRQYHCFKCRKHFMRPERLEFHEMRHNENMDEFICSTCGKDFSGENSLYEHYLFVHKGVRPHVCEVCGKSFQLKTRLKEHHRIHTGEKPYQCEKCGHRCMTTHALKFHMKSHVPTRHTCEICGKAFIKKQNWNEHLEKHWKKDENISLPQTFPCPMCSYKPPTFRMLRNHMIGVHLLDHQDPLIMKQKPLHECNECQEKFKHQMSLKAHKEKVHEGKAGPRIFQCDLCKAEFKIKQMLINHIKSKHGEKRYMCAKCNMRFADFKALHKHISLHRDTKPFICGYCNMTFRRKDTRDAHRRVHTDNRPYQCTDCDKSFSSCSSRSNHRRKVHKDNKTECSECGDKYGNLQIKIHMNDHLGEQLSIIKST